MRAACNRDPGRPSYGQKWIEQLWLPGTLQICDQKTRRGLNLLPFGDYASLLPLFHFRAQFSISRIFTFFRPYSIQFDDFIIVDVKEIYVAPIVSKIPYLGESTYLIYITTAYINIYISIFVIAVTCIIHSSTLCYFSLLKFIII